MKKIYSRIEAIAGNVITVNAGGRRATASWPMVSSARQSSLAEVIRLDEDRVSLQVFAGGRGVSTGDEVRFLGHPMQVSFSDEPARAHLRRQRPAARRGPGAHART